MMIVESSKVQRKLNHEIIVVCKGRKEKFLLTSYCDRMSLQVVNVVI